MDGLLERIAQLETRTRHMEGQLRKWRVLAFSIGVCAVGWVCVIFRPPSGGRRTTRRGTRPFSELL